MSDDPDSAGDDPQRGAAGRRLDAAAPIVIVAARDEAERVGATITAIAAALPGARLIVADDGSIDDTARIAREAGAEVASAGASRGKGAAVTAVAEALLAPPAATGRTGADNHSEGESPPTVLFCDGDLGASAAELTVLVGAVERGECDLAVAAFARRVGGGLGVARGAGRWAIRRLCGLKTEAPLSGQRAMRAEVLRAVLPLAGGFGMEVGMTVDAVRAGFRVKEMEVELKHRATGRSAGGFIHRGRQLRDIVRAYRGRRRRRRLRAP